MFAIFLGAWAVDTSISGGVARNVWLAKPDTEPIALQRSSADDIRSVAEDLTRTLAEESTVVTIGTVAVRTDLVQLGASVDADALVSSALDARRGSLLTRPFSWAASFVRPITLDIPYVVDAETTDAAVSSILVPALDSPQPPTVRLVNDVYQPIPGRSGVVVNPAALVEEVATAVVAAPPHDLRLTPIATQPNLRLDQVGAVAVDLNRHVGSPLQVSVLGQNTVLTPEQLRAIIEITDGDGGPTWEVIQSKALNELRPAFTGLGSNEQQARFVVIREEPVIIPAQETVVCCDDRTASLLAEAIASEPETPEATEDNPDPGPALRSVELSPRVTDGTAGVGELEALGVVELVATFETAHKCCENRVTNIHLFADKLRGALIRPGETLSLNEHIGERTEEAGFVEAGAISLGKLEAQFGGGVSQVATTTFNAAFFAGLEFPEYQSHSLYFSRYPRGREATINWTRPDLKIKNPTPYGVLIWTEYTDTAVTVSIYSTKYAEVTDAGRTERKQGICTRVTTTRERVYPDGTKDTDTVFALYRQEQGLDCNGNPSDPDDVVEDPDPDPEPNPAETVPPDSIPSQPVPPPTTATTVPATTTTVLPTTTTEPTTTSSTEPPTSSSTSSSSTSSSSTSSSVPPG